MLQKQSRLLLLHTPTAERRKWECERGTCSSSTNTTRHRDKPHAHTQRLFKRGQPIGGSPINQLVSDDKPPNSQSHPTAKAEAMRLPSSAKPPGQIRSDHGSDHDASSFAFITSNSLRIMTAS